MKLSIEQIKEIAVGAVRVYEENGAIELFRFTEEESEFYKNKNADHYMKSLASSGMRLAVAHNLYFYNNLTRKIREALDGGYFESFYQKYRNILGERSQD